MSVPSIALDMQPDHRYGDRGVYKWRTWVLKWLGNTTNIDELKKAHIHLLYFNDELEIAITNANKIELGICYSCKRNDKINFHIFLDCPFSR
jgi:hypothetical protein